MWNVTLKLNTTVSNNYTSLVERSVVDDILQKDFAMFLFSHYLEVELEDLNF